jgi:hypothetical protein
MANPPPPYDNITGISRAAMKDNAQVTLAEYDGNARPGELVVDQTTSIMWATPWAISQQWPHRVV